MAYRLFFGRWQPAPTPRSCARLSCGPGWIAVASGGRANLSAPSQGRYETTATTASLSTETFRDRLNEMHQDLKVWYVPFRGCVPNPYPLRSLRGVIDGNVTLRPLAISDRRGEAELVVPRTPKGWSSNRTILAGGTDGPAARLTPQNKINGRLVREPKARPRTHRFRRESRACSAAPAGCAD